MKEMLMMLFTIKQQKTQLFLQKIQLFLLNL